MAKIMIPTALKQYADGQEEVDLPATTVDEALDTLTNRHPGLKKHLYSESGALRNFVNIYLNDEDVRYLERGKTKLNAASTLSIIPAIAGGAATTTRRPLARNGHTTLDKQEIQRYSRHLIMPEVGMEGQKKLKAASVLLHRRGRARLAARPVPGGGGRRARIGLVDFDVVDFSNLQRQIIHGTSGRRPAEAAVGGATGCGTSTRTCSVNCTRRALTSENALEIVRDYDIIVDGTDNFPTRYLVNDACVLLGKPNVYGSIFRFEGQASVFWARGGAVLPLPLSRSRRRRAWCRRCAEGGVLGVLPGIIGAIQANEAIKLILGIGEPLIGRLLLFDALEMKFRELKLRKDPDCPVCGDAPDRSRS